MNSEFNQLISDQNLEKQMSKHLTDLSSSGVDYACLYSKPCDDPCLLIQFDNVQQMSRITLRESGECTVEVISMRNSELVINETLKLKTMAEFEDRLVNLIEHMKETHKLH